MSREQWGHGYYKGIVDGIKMRASFYDYCIALHDGEDSPFGDFVNDIKRDSKFPRDSTKRKTVWNHLRHSGACREALSTFLELWDEWWICKM